MPTDPPLTDEEQTILHVLMAPGSRPSNTTMNDIAQRSGLGAEAGRILRGLERRDPPLVMHQVDESIGVEFWISTYDAAEALDPPPDL